jgi:hypothetical protein
MRPSDRPFFTLALALVAALAVRCLAGCQAQQSGVVLVEAASAPLASRTVVPWQGSPRSVVPVTLDMPDKCHRLIAVDTPSGPQLDKERPAWLRDTRKRWARQLEVREMIRATAEVMGADATVAEMLWRKAVYESSGDAQNVHIRSKDVAANASAAAKGRRRASERWRHARVKVYRRHRGELVEAGHHDAWALGRGLYGQVSGLHVHRWGADAPPWVLCDPIVATATVIWSMRAGLDECHGSTLRDAYRRFSSGKCAERTPELEARFDRLARGRVRGLRLDAFDPDLRAELGSDWPEETADRVGLLRAVQRKLAGLE